MSIRLLLVAGAVLLTVAPALGQPAGQTPPGTGQTQVHSASRQAAPQTTPGTIIAAEDSSQVRVETLLGMKVVNTAGEEVGIVDDIVFDKAGTVSGLVVEAGGLMGIGAKPIGVAWRDVGSALTSNVIRVSLTKDDIDRAPPFKVGNEHSETLKPQKPLGLVPLKSDEPRR
jgi:sporulation protein YlmC with PRC-barrel domain